jgi:hypothetical protein
MKITRRDALALGLLLVALLPMILGLGIRGLELRAANKALTSSGGVPAPAHVAAVLQSADTYLLLGFAASLGMFLLLTVFSLTAGRKRLSEILLCLGGVVGLGVVSSGTWALVELNKQVGNFSAQASVGQVGLTEAEVEEMNRLFQAQYVEVYDHARPVNASDQFSEVSQEMRAEYAAVNLQRRIGVWIGMSAALLALVVRSLEQRKRSQLA